MAQQGHPPADASLEGNRSNKKPQAGGRVFWLEGEEVEDLAATASSTPPVNHLYTQILFNSSATHSFVNPKFAKKLANKPDKMDIQLYLTTHLGSVHHTNITFKNCAINAKGRVLTADLVQLDIHG